MNSKFCFASLTLDNFSSKPKTDLLCINQNDYYSTFTLNYKEISKDWNDDWRERFWHEADDDGDADARESARCITSVTDASDSMFCIFFHLSM